MPCTRIDQGPALLIAAPLSSDRYGQLGTNAVPIKAKLPVAVDGGHSFTKLSGQYRHYCAIEVDTTLWCWGQNSKGEVAPLAACLNCFAPIRAASSVLTSWLDVAVGMLHSCALAENGTVFCFGFNGYGNLGIGTIVNSPGVPKRVAPKVKYNFTQIAAGSHHTCGLLAGGQAMCWGWNNMGQMAGNLTAGAAYYYSLPRAWWPKHTFIKIVCGATNTYAIE